MVQFHALLTNGSTAVICHYPQDMGAISSVNLLKNDIGVAQAEDLLGILKDHLTLKSLCGNKGNETALDMSGKMNGAADAIMLVAEIIDNGAMTALNLSSNAIGGYAVPAGWKYLPFSPPNSRFYNTATKKNQGEPPAGASQAGYIAVANAIKDMETLTSLDLSSNYLYAKGSKIIAEAIKVLIYTIAVVLAPFSCLSDYWLNCCCLLLSTG